jgi:hypothetical protein
MRYVMSNILIINKLDDGAGLTAGFAMRVLVNIHNHTLHFCGCVCAPIRNNWRRRFGAVRVPKGHEGGLKKARQGMLTSGGAAAAPVIVGTAGAPLFHRRESPTQTRADAAKQVTSMEVWGRAARGSPTPSVKAYRNALPPAPARGIEFCSGVSPTPGTGTPYEARWRMGSPGMVVPPGGIAFAAIPVSYIKNTQVP